MPKFRNARRQKADEANKSFTEKRCREWFDKYKEPYEDAIVPEGLQKLANDLGIQCNDVVLIVLEWKCQAKKSCHFTWEEWKQGMTDLECDCNSKLMRRLPDLRGLLKTDENFKAIYEHAFHVNTLDRYLHKDAAKVLLEILLTDKWPLCDRFIQFLGQNEEYKWLYRDQWNGILWFSQKFSENLDTYDPTECYPVIIDDFVEWMQKQ